MWITVNPGEQWHRPVALSHTPPFTHRHGSMQPSPTDPPSPAGRCIRLSSDGSYRGTKQQQSGSFPPTTAGETFVLAVHAVVPRRTHPVPALRPAESGLTKAAAVDVEAARAVCTVAHTFTVLAVGTCRALLITPEGPNRRTHGGDPGAFGIDRSYSYSASLGKYYNKELKDLVAASSSSLNSENPYATIKDLPGPPFCPPESSYMEMKAAVPRERAYTEISPPPFSMATLRRERQSSLGHGPHDDPQSHYDLPVNSHIPGHYDLPPVRRPPSPRRTLQPLKAAHKVQNPKNISKDAEFNWKKERSPCDQFYRATQTEDEDEEEG
ncbi:hypothetical protein CCH79_00015497 [Gambusia affinis]|uniref:Uncharacterized protein n=1 Tax=Gambusia affinis TaxID=33528 RepID=A0A315VN29_GAMAF|nr:hypothetical protein CCH79_00015497 [Gambusia affinis]